MNVLVADDDDAVRRVVVRVLTARGHRCAQAACLADMEAVMRESAPDAVVSDVGLGADDGLEACLKLRAGRPRLPILMMTGDLRSAQRVAAAGLGPALDKPFMLSEFEAALAAIGA